MLSEGDQSIRVLGRRGGPTTATAGGGAFPSPRGRHPFLGEA
jgi:hypothetical protein